MQPFGDLFQLTIIVDMHCMGNRKHLFSNKTAYPKVENPTCTTSRLPLVCCKTSWQASWSMKATK